MISYPLAFGEGRIKERVKYVLHYQKPVFWAIIASVGVCAVMSVCFLTNPKEDVLAEEERNDNDIQMAGTDDRENHDDGETITFDGVIVEHTIESEEPLIMILPTGDEIPYEYVCFILPTEEAYWAEPINMNSVVSVTCKDFFEETQPAFGELISISRAGNSPDLQAMFRDFGITIQLPGNSRWIQDREYRQPDEVYMEIYYHDAILNADCKLLVVRDRVLELPDMIFDESSEETWEGAAVFGQKVYVRVQRSADGKQVLATWEYEEYQFAIWAEAPSEVTDIGAVPKTALGIISNLE